MEEEVPMHDDFYDDFAGEPEPEQDSEPEADPEPEVKMPVIIPIDEKPKYVRTYTRSRKTNQSYKVSEKVLKRNKDIAQKNRERRAEEKRKLAEYEKLVQTKSLTRDEADRLLNEKFIALEERITSKVKAIEIPKIAPIPEEPQGYTSDTQRRFSTRFKQQPTSPMGYDRFRRF